MEQTRWEFLVICSDIAAYKTITRTLSKTNPVVDYTSGIATARAFIERRKIDGIFLDMELPGALELVQNLRQGGSNRSSVIFACIAHGEDPGQLLNAGVNYALYKPLLTNAVLDALESASPAIEAERKRYLRYHLTVPVVIRLQERNKKPSRPTSAGAGWRSAASKSMSRAHLSSSTSICLKPRSKARAKLPGRTRKALWGSSSTFSATKTNRRSQVGWTGKGQDSSCSTAAPRPCCLSHATATSAEHTLINPS